MTPILIIARLTIKEMSRRRLLLAVAILTLLMIFATGWGLRRLIGLQHCGSNGGLGCDPVQRTAIAATLVILLAYMFSIVLAMAAAFLAATALATDIDSGVLLALLPRPLRRRDVVLGKWLGLATVLGSYAALTGALELGGIRLMTGYGPPHPLQALACLVAESFIVLTLALLASTRLAPITAGIVVVVLFEMAWIAGIAAFVGTSFHVAAVSNGATAFGLLLPTDGLWRGAIYNLEPAAIAALDRAGGSTNPFSVTGPPAMPYLIWALGWTVFVLTLAVFSLSRRDL